MSGELSREDLLQRKSLGPVPYVERYLLDNQYEMLPDCSFRRLGKSVPVSEIVTAMKVQHFIDQRAIMKRKKGATGFPDKILEAGLDVIMFQQRDEHLSSAVSELKYDDSLGDSEVRSYIMAMTGGKSQLDVAVLQHWMRNVKRRMLGMPVTYHIFPVFFGRQGGGKSEGLKKLLSPLKWYCMEVGSVVALTDERNFKAISEKYVAILDEMARSDRADAQILKNLVSSEVLSARALGTNRRDRFVANCSYIGTSNNPLQEILYDPSGMRRFYEVRCAEKGDWDSVNSIDYRSLWRSVDPERDYLSDHRDALREHQEDIRQPTQVEQFVAELGLRPGSAEDPSHRKSNTTVYQNYVRWADEVGKTKRLDSAALGRSLGTLGFPPWSGREDGKRVRGYYVEVKPQSDGSDSTSWGAYPGYKATQWSELPSDDPLVASGRRST